MADGIFKSLQRFFSRSAEGDVEEDIDGGVSPADVSITEPQLQPVEEIKPSPVLVGEDDFHHSFGTRTNFAGQEVSHDQFVYRQEHEPYRFEPEGDKKVCITKAHLYEVHPLNNQDADLNNHSVKIHELTPLVIETSDDCVIYAQYVTDNHGQVISEPKLDDTGQQRFDDDTGEPFTGDGPTYRLKKIDMAQDGSCYPPTCVHFVPPDESGLELVVNNGQYNIPICWIRDGKLYRNHWGNDELNEKAYQKEARENLDKQEDRQVLLAGGLEGHRGPMWWIAGYNSFQNIGFGSKVYKQYLKSTDFHQLRSIDDRGQEVPSPNPEKMSGLAQVQVKTIGDEIKVYGNRYNKHWKIDNKGVAVVEDGLVKCFQNLSCESVTVQTLATDTVYNGTVEVVKCNTTESIENGSIIQGTPHNTMWAGGEEKTLPWVKICVETSTSNYSGNSEACYWVIGYEITNAALEATPASITTINGPSTVTGVTSAVTVTGISSTTAGSFSCTSAISTTSPVTVYKYDGSTTQFIQPPSGNSDGAELKFVKCPDSDLTDSCPDPIPPAE